MNPLFFGESKKQLFGVYHPPRSRILRDTSIVLCYPHGQEYLRSHRMFKRLADLLARAGFHVLRFDYYGSGDSSGSSSEWSFDGSCQDLVSAVNELKDVSGNSSVSLVGLRLGATIAALAGITNVKDWLFWDPVINGRDYLGSLKSMHQEMLVHPMRFRHLRNEEGKGELLGYPLSDKACSELEQLDLTESSRVDVGQVHILCSTAKDEYSVFRDHLAFSCGRVEYHVIDDAGEWDVVEYIESALLVKNILHEIVAILSKDAN